MRTLFLALIVLLLAAASAAQTGSRNASYKEPPAATYTDSLCLELQVRMLYEATDLTLNLSEQEKRLNAADAYGKLWGLQQPC